MNPIRLLAIWLGGQPWMPRFLPQIVALDKLLQRLSRGRFTLLTLTGLPELFLTVPGRKSGIPRTTPLLCVPHEGEWLVAGSNWGQPKQPLWVGNLLAAEQATVEFRGSETTVVPHLVEGAERARLWSIMQGTWPNYAKYAERTEREIKVFRLAPQR
ncbi:nitroreductase family deazaflavin-dependent oxidoreductase [Nocardioides sp.]|uniref:nitroreductase family deazaflavin-dependent oxidoreductase n=1 Tax=Nocardioides sp. TaxID=35761 RepID=UPI0027341E27|nr:nitroreductase family deazaflavin-dependent oxidoreductase [Nocardioides sp.]MDP3893145.1 nitroreductase family deazaflavin-dependent oxidoreductase [Nocardioides sp.]